jgi:hypothetical protein
MFPQLTEFAVEDKMGKQTLRLMIPAIAVAAIGLIGTTRAASAYDRHIELENRSHMTIVAFYASNVGTNDWQEDVLGSDLLRPGYRIRLDLDDGTSYCHFDFMTVFRDGTKVVRNDVNVCALNVYTLRD